MGIYIIKKKLMKNFAILLLLGAINLQEFTEATKLKNQDKLDAKFLDDDDDEVKPEDQVTTMVDLADSKNSVSSMWSGAADISLVDTETAPAKPPHHFDLLGLAQGLSETATVAQTVSKL